MRAHARKHADSPAKKRRSQRKCGTRTTPPPPAPPPPPANPGTYYEAGWTDSWQHRRCLHKHKTPIEAAQCALPHGCGWYVFAVENGYGRELNDTEEQIVNRYRFNQE